MKFGDYHQPHHCSFFNSKYLVVIITSTTWIRQMRVPEFTDNVKNLRKKFTPRPGKFFWPPQSQNPTYLTGFKENWTNVFNDCENLVETYRIVTDLHLTNSEILDQSLVICQIHLRFCNYIILYHLFSTTIFFFIFA